MVPQAPSCVDRNPRLAVIRFFMKRWSYKARSNFDISHRFVATFIYDFPFGQGRHWGNHAGLMNAVFGAGVLWPLRPLRAATRLPLNSPALHRHLTQPGQPRVWLPMQQRPNQILPNNQAVTQGRTIGPNRLPTSAQNAYLNAAAFAYPAPFTPATPGRNRRCRPPSAPRHLKAFDPTGPCEFRNPL
jgi:hypothetical protein